MEIRSIKYTSDDILNSLDILMNKDCQRGKHSLIKIKEIATNTDILYLIEKGKPIYFLLLDPFVKHKTIYIHDICVSKLHRGKSLFKKSLSFLKEYYRGKGYDNFTLDASDSRKEEGLDQKSRIHIFHSAGFHINTETGYFTSSNDYKVIKTIVLLDNNDTVEVQKREGEKYIVKNNDGKEYFVIISQIEKCLDSDLNPIPCPMIMNIALAGGLIKKRKTRKNSKNNCRLK